MRVDQWSLSLQRQIGDWLLSGTYLGNHTINLPASVQINPAVFIPGVGDANGNCTHNGQVVPFTVSPGRACSSTRNTRQRRVLTLADPEKGQFYGQLQRVDWGATASYNGLLLNIQRRAATGVNLNANYTWSHCITDPGGIQTGTLGSQSYQNPDNRSLDRGDCREFGSDRRHLFNLSGVIESPQFSSPGLRAVASNWRLSPILRILSGGPINITSGRDRALTGISGRSYQRPDLVGGDVYGDKTSRNYLNGDAFAQAALGTHGNLGRGNVHGPGSWGLDIALSRSFEFGEDQRLEFRAEAFNVTNSVRLNNPSARLSSSSSFGRIFNADDPRIMQFALKYFF